MPAGRKSLRDEIQVLQRYAELSVPYFKYIKECLDSENVEDKRWASERLDKAFVKMIPQVLEGDPENPIHVIQGFQYVTPQNANDSNHRPDSEATSGIPEASGQGN